MTSQKFLDNGSTIVSTVSILKRNLMIKVLNPEKFPGEVLLPGTLGRIHSQRNGVYTVWLLEERTMNTVMIEIPLNLMGQYFQQRAHNIFPHLASG